MEIQHPRRRMAGAGGVESAPWLLICVLGSFRVLHSYVPITLRSRGNAESLLINLAVHPEYGSMRGVLMEALWPDGDSTLTAQSLNSLVYGLNKQLSNCNGDTVPILYQDGCYRLNVEGGVQTDLARFEAFAATGDRQTQGGDTAGAVDAYQHAVDAYRGDLCASADLHAVIERERFRVTYLNLLARLADFWYGRGDYATCLGYAQKLLAKDPFREDAHRMVMRCHVRRDERAQAFRQYRLCQEILLEEFDALPEPATVALFEQVRLDPSGV